MNKVNSNKPNSGIMNFDNLLVVFVAILFIVSIASAFQLNELSGKIASFEKAPQTTIVLSGSTDNANQGSTSNANSNNAKKSDQEILDKLSNAPDMVGGC